MLIVYWKEITTSAVICLVQRYATEEQRSAVKRECQIQGHQTEVPSDDRKFTATWRSKEAVNEKLLDLGAPNESGVVPVPA